MELSLTFMLMWFLLTISNIKGEGDLEPVATPIADEMKVLESDIPEVNNNKSDVTKCLKECKGEEPPTTCADGPYYKYYEEEGYTFQPPIRYKTCSKLTCRDLHSCVATRSYVKFQWTTACKCDGLGGCEHTERRCVRFIEQPECQCKCATPVYNCQLGYVWNPMECKCVSKECPPAYHFDSTSYECIEDHSDYF